MSIADEQMLCIVMKKNPPKMASLQIMAENLEFVAFFIGIFYPGAR